MDYIAELKRRNEKALDYIIDKYSNYMFKVAYKVLKNRELSEECLNDVFLKVWDNINNFDKGEEKFYSWILTITKYTAIDILRKESKHFNLNDISKINLSDYNVKINGLEEKENLEEVTKEINSMNELDREIFYRRFYLDHSSKSVSKSLGLTEKIINLRVFRGRKKLREKFNKGK